VTGEPATGYPCWVPTLFRRKTNEAAVEPVTEAEAETPVNRSKAYTPSKRERGMTTPKRGAANARLSTPASKVPVTREERREARAAQTAERRSMRQAMMRGEEKALLPRDQGPVRRLVRDIVDARRNVGNYFFGLLILLTIFTSNRNPAIASLGLLLFVAMFLLLIIDSWALTRRIKRVVTAKLPRETPQRWRSTYTYGIMRAISFRFMRMPKPQVKIGTKLV